MRSGNRYRRLYSGITYDPAAVALFAAMTTQPDQTRKGLIDRTVRDLKSDGLWGKFDALYVFAAHAAQPARVNWVAPGTYDAVATSSPTFATDRGYTGDGAASYLETNFTPSSAPSPKFTQNSGHLSFWSRTAASGSGIDMGNSNALLLTYQTTTNNFAHRINAGSSGVVVVATGATFAVTSRTGSASTDNPGYRDGASASAGSAVSASVDTNSIRILSRSGSVSFSSRQCAMASIGGGLTAAEVLSFDTIMRRYMTAVGA